MRKKIFCILIIISSVLQLNAAEKYLLQYKPNEDLRYKYIITPLPNTMANIEASLVEMTSKSCIVTISFLKQNDENLVMNYSTQFYKEKSCFNPFSYIGYVYNIEHITQINIKPSGYFISNKTNDISMGCCLGFNLFRKSVEADNTQDNKNIFLCYFLENEIPINSVWKNTFEIQNENKRNSLDIVYTLDDIKNNIAHITGNINGKLFIEADFNITKGYWIYYKTYYLENNTKKYFTTLELM